MEYPSVEQVAHKVVARVRSSPRPSIILGIGLPGSGKSAVLSETDRQLGNDSRLIDIDQLRIRALRLRAGGSSVLSIMQKEVLKVSSLSIERGSSVLIDSTNVDQEMRPQDIERYKRLGHVSVGGVFMATDAETAKRRNSQRSVTVLPICIDQMQTNLQERVPSLDDGFDWLVTVDRNGIHTESVDSNEYY